MSSNNRTPASILEPGERTFEVLHVNGHPNRAQRRHEIPFQFLNGQPTVASVFVPKHLQRKARNTVYVKPVTE